MEDLQQASSPLDASLLIIHLRHTGSLANNTVIFALLVEQEYCNCTQISNIDKVKRVLFQAPSNSSL